MADVITRFKVETAEYDRKIDQSKKKLGEMGNAGKSAGSALSEFADKMGVSVGAMTAMTAATAATSAAIKVAKDAFFQSESNIDEWGRTVEGAKGAYDYFLQALNNGNWSNFFTNLNEAIRGSRDLYDQLDRLGSIKANNAAAIALTQQEVQQLRLRQQNGEDVTKELEDATRRLAKLQSEEVEAGMESGTKQMVETLKHAGISEEMARAVVEELTKGGQAAFDKYAQMYQDLTKKGTGKGEYVDILGLINYYDEGEFDVANLSEEERKMYELAKAITERETALQEGLATFAQAVQQGTASAREEYKNTKIAGAGGGKTGGGKTAGKTAGGTSGNGGSQKWSGAGVAMPDDLKMVQGWGEDGDAIYIPVRFDYSEIEDGIDIEEISEALDPKVLEEWQKSWDSLQESMRNNATSDMIGAFNALGDAIGGTEGNMIKLIASMAQQIVTAYANIKALRMQEEALLEQAAARGMNTTATLADATANGIDTTAKIADIAVTDKAAAAAGVDAVAKATEAAAATEDATSQTLDAGAKAMNAHSWIPWVGVAIGVGMVATIIATLAKMPKFATGGIVAGNKTSGDNQLVRVNSGELILNRAQQGALASQLQSDAERRDAQPYLQAETIYVGLSNYLRRTGRGEIMTTR